MLLNNPDATIQSTQILITYLGSRIRLMHALFDAKIARIFRTSITIIAAPITDTLHHVSRR
jgi:hypothetical protein